MADLTTAPATGNQKTTQNPQAAPSGQSISGASAQSGGVQPGTARDVLTSQNGLTLGISTPTAVNLNATTSTVATTQPKPAAQNPEHHVNSVLVAGSVVLVIIAIVLFGAINRSAKKTTD